MKEFLQGLGQSVKRIVQSKTVLAAAAGVSVSMAQKAGWLPDIKAVDYVESFFYILCAIFRVTAITDLKTGQPLQ